MAMTIMAELARGVTGGVDTHLDVHVAAVLDEIGGLLGTESFAATGAGEDKLASWLGSFGPLMRVGVEGTGSYGAGLARLLAASGVDVVEVDRPNRQLRRRQGKTDTVDAIEAARAAQSGRAVGHAKSRDGNVEAIRALVVAKRSAVNVRTSRSTRSAISASPRRNPYGNGFLGSPPPRSPSRRRRCDHAPVVMR
jgi:transposase